MKNIKCLFLTTEFPPGPGGIGIHSFYIIKEMKRQYNWDFNIVLTQLDNASAKEMDLFKEKYLFPIFLLKKSPNIFRLIINIFVLFIHALKYNPNVIISSGKHATWFAAILKFFSRKKLISFGHGSEFGTKIAKEIKINKLSYSFSDLIISVSHYTLNFINNQTDVKVKKHVVVSNGADDHQFFKIDSNLVNIFKKKNGLTNRRIITTVGNVSERKGQWVTIKAMPHILKSFPNTYYYCIGNDSQKKKYMTLAKKLNVYDNIVFTGKKSIEELNIWLNCSDIFIMTSTHTSKGDFEGFGIAVIEAALCGVPAIVSKGNNGVIESIEEDKTGFGVEEKNYKEVAEKVNFLLTNDKLRELMGENARKRAIKSYTWKIKVKEIYKKINNLYLK